MWLAFYAIKPRPEPSYKANNRLFFALLIDRVEFGRIISIERVECRIMFSKQLNEIPDELSQELFNEKH